jgi:hypothetical protein
MPKSVACIVIAALASSAAHAGPPVPKAKEIQDALRREQTIKRLSEPPKSVLNICRGC